MQTLNRILIAAMLAALAVACNKKESGGGEEGSNADTSDLQTDAERFSYAIGTQYGRQLKQVKEDVDMSALQKGIAEAIEGKPSRLTDQEREASITTVSKKLQQKQMEERTAKAKENKEKGEKFLSENKGKEGVKTTASGLQYKIVTEGKGPAPTANDKVTVNYRGTLVDGTEFDSSYKRNQPATFPVRGVIPGWTEGLQLMHEGGKAMFYIPSDLAYGERGQGSRMGPNETLIFEVELLKVEKGEAPKAPPASPKKADKDKK